MMPYTRLALIIACLVLLSMFIPVTAAGQPLDINMDGFLLDDIYPGAFRTWNKNPNSISQGNFNYYADIALWAGVVINGQRVVIAGDGNPNIPSFPEWQWESPLQPDSMLQQSPNIEFAYRGELSDQRDLPGHESVGLRGSILLSKIVGIPALVVNIELTGESSVDSLVLGVKCDFDVPNKGNIYNPEDDIIQIINGHDAVIIRNRSRSASEPIVGLLNLQTSNTHNTHFSVYKRPDSTLTDAEQYAILIADNIKGRFQQPGDYRIVLSTLPQFYVAGDTLKFMFAIVQTKGMNRFMRTLNSVERWYSRVPLAKGASLPQEPEELVPGKPEHYYLSDAYPNPFNPATSINFSLPEERNVQMEVFNIAGQRVSYSDYGKMTPGVYTFKWDTRQMDLSSGVYIIRISAGSRQFFQKALLIK